MKQIIQLCLVSLILTTLVTNTFAQAKSPEKFFKDFISTVEQKDFITYPSYQEYRDLQDMQDVQDVPMRDL